MLHHIPDNIFPGLGVRAMLGPGLSLLLDKRTHMGVHATQPFPFAKTVCQAYPGAIAFVLIMVWQAAGFMVGVDQVYTVYNIRMDALATTGLCKP